MVYPRKCTLFITKVILNTCHVAQTPFIEFERLNRAQQASLPISLLPFTVLGTQVRL